MNKLFSLPIRLQLFILVLCMAVFSMGIIVFTGVRERLNVLSEARQEMQAFATIIAVQQQALTESTEQLLAAVSRMPELRQRNAAKLRETLAASIKMNPEYATIFVTNHAGDIWCSALPTKALKISDRESFEKALTSGHFSSGQYKMGQYSGKQVLSFYYPYKNEKGEIIGVIILGIDLAYIKQMLMYFQMPQDSGYLLLDHKGIILSGGGKRDFIGQHYEETAFNRMKNGPETDTFVATGHDGRRRLISYQKLRLAGEQTPYLYVRAGIPVAAVMAQANTLLSVILISFMTCLLGVLYLAWLIGKRSITDRLALLEKSSLRMAEGDMTVRVADLVSGGELGNLGQTFDHMAAQLSSRENKLKTSERQLRESQRVARIGHYVLDVSAGVWTSSEALDDIFGIGPDYVRSVEGWQSIIYPDERAEMLEYFTEHVLRDRKPFDREYRIMRKSDGAVRWVHGLGNLTLSPGGKTIGMFGTIQDITERKLVEEKMQQSEQLIRNILDTVDEGFIVIDRDYRIQTANRAYCEQVSLPCEEIVGRRCFSVSHERTRPCHEEGEECAVQRVFEDGQPHSVLHRHQGPGDTVLFLEIKAFPMKDASGNITSAIEVLANVTGKRLLDEERLKTQKLEAVGTLAGGIAHDFNNLLQGVFGYISLAKMKKDDRNKSIEALDQAEQALHMAVNLTNQLLTFSKGGKPVKKTIDLLPVIQNAAKFALSGSRTNYHIRTDVDLCRVEADEGQVSQVIQNIVLNADQAMKDSGRIDITARDVQIPGPDLPAELERGRYVEIAITDTGSGIPEKYIHKIFDPYFTTKERGSGLGLATSYSVIKNHKGLIDVKSATGKGTTFRIYLPAEVITTTEKRQTPAITAPGRKGKILVMDDEKIVLKIAGELIRTLGHEVEFAANGTEAFEKFLEARKREKPFDIAILDLTVRGGMGGTETVKRLLEIDPGVKAVVSSGYSDDSAIAFYEKQGFKAVLKKPYNVDQLQEVLNRLLNT